MRFLSLLALLALTVSPAIAQQPNVPGVASSTWAGFDHAVGGTGPITANFTSTVIAWDVEGGPGAPFALINSPASAPGGPISIPGLNTALLLGAPGFGIFDLNLVGFNVAADGLAPSSFFEALCITNQFGDTNFTLPINGSTNFGGMQVLIVDTTSPFGLTLTAATDVQVTFGNFFVLPQTDESLFTINLAFGSVDFYNVNHTTIGLHSNGHIDLATAGFGTSFAVTQGQFNNSLPRVAPLWADLDPGAGGAVAFTETAAGFTYNLYAVPEFGGIGANDFAVTYDYGTMAWTFHYDQGIDTAGNPIPGVQTIGAASPAITGITPGGGLASTITTVPSWADPAVGVIGCGGIGSIPTPASPLQSFNNNNATGQPHVFAAGCMGVASAITFTPQNTTGVGTEYIYQ